MTNQPKHSLEAPTVPAAEPDGLIKVADLQSDIVVHLPVWRGAISLDSYQLLVNGLTIGDPVQLPTPLPDVGSLLTRLIPIATELMNDGNYSIAYRTISFPGQNIFDSEMTVIKIDRTAPGAALLAPIIFPNITFGDSLAGLIPGYAGMGRGDRIQTVCNGVHGPVILVEPENLTTSLIKIQFDKAFLLSFETDKLVINYSITDRAGNVSITSKTMELTINQ
ncbi:hypothetical protein QN382_06385 [Pseudomonas sp. 10B1]|uniref:hypothetical protein n=1 Tax=unclassified Pseudomonas TaxID=196821 RepID=UPI002AB43988|nr:MULTISPECIES: hypothetical protein [unclassified Pseudomonas]MDY7561017.1 hypothetical protein [Pseudomonas sp. AB6]MEA9977086.1 hypothetical protein [Pseudomonas sp. RTS4]MEA9995054.1 hypothetical protein [Pseudomonas sp. AA4]MEB0086903.1 hypothetical protein [Pseudomonas sp. RTI1]MEB0126830.1 hypothetical protein [Pseudomonas sp. CCC1.2]